MNIENFTTEEKKKILNLLEALDIVDNQTRFLTREQRKKRIEIRNKIQESLRTELNLTI